MGVHNLAYSNNKKSAGIKGDAGWFLQIPESLLYVTFDDTALGVADEQNNLVTFL